MPRQAALLFLMHATRLFAVTEVLLRIVGAGWSVMIEART